ncbi:MAG: family four-helix-bundle protein [Flavipsychrobacter sp.]|jgi:uncharacterized protein (TIGR02284 family)|nr:family four-helix-bundle protein [Flavipsychrobacter sp.]
MIFQYPQVSKTTQALKDLIRINNDRIGGYQAALHQSASLAESTRDLFKSIIDEGILYRQELMQKVKQLDHDVRTSPNILGKIYMAWSDLKVTFACDTQRAIITNCLYNEEIALHAYRAALSKGAGISGDVLQMLAEHETGLKRNYELLKCYREMRHTADSSLMYMV